MNASEYLRRVVLTVVGVSFFGATPLFSASVQTYPYTNTFEQYPYYGAGKIAASGTEWTTNGEGAVYVTNGVQAAGSKSCHIFSDALNLNSDVSNWSNLWVRIFCKPTAYDDAGGAQPSAANSSAAFYVSTNGTLYAYADTNGAGANGWTNVASGLPTNGWLGFTVHLDYSNKLWDIYYCTNSSSLTTTNMAKYYTAPLKMAFGHSNRLWQATISSGGTSYVDEVTIAKGYAELKGAFALASPSNVQYVSSMTISRGMGARTIAKYFGPSSDALGQELGAALHDALDVGDVVRLYFPGQGVLGDYTNTLSGWEWLSDPDGADVMLARITHTTGMWLEDTASTGTITILSFAPYDSVNPTNTTVFGANTGGGWNLFQWPYASRSVNATPGLGFASVQAGDLIFIYDGTSGKYIRLWYKAGTGWMQGNTRSTYALQEGQGFWYKRAGNGPVWWNIESVR